MDEKNIGALAKFIGVSQHTIKYYDKIGLLSSTRDEKSNYRRYSVRTIADLGECIKYRNIGFSLKELSVLRGSVDEQSLSEMLDNRVKELDAEIGHLKKMRGLAERYRRETIEVEERLNQWFIEPCPYLYIRNQTEGLMYKENGSLEADGINLMDFTPDTKSVAIISKNFFHYGEIDFAWGQGCICENPWVELEKSSAYEAIHSQKAFVTYVKDKGNYLTNGSIVEIIRKIYQEYANEVQNNIYIFRIKIVFDEEENDWHYFKVYIPL